MTLRSSGTADIAASPEAVFELYCDAARRAEWQYGVRAITQLTGSLRNLGTRYVMELVRAPASTVEVSRSDPPHFHEEHFRSGPVSGAHRAIVDRTATGTRFTYEADATISVVLVGGLLERAFAARSRLEIRANVERFAALANRTASGNSQPEGDAQ